MILGETGSQSKESVEVSVWKLCVYMSLFFFSVFAWLKLLRSWMQDGNLDFFSYVNVKFTRSLIRKG